jgi:hypothetical protein
VQPTPLASIKPCNQQEPLDLLGLEICFIKDLVQELFNGMVKITKEISRKCFNYLTYGKVQPTLLVHVKHCNQHLPSFLMLPKSVITFEKYPDISLKIIKYY